MMSIMPEAPTEEAVQKFTAFRARRDDSVRGPQGPLALALTHWVLESQQIDGVPGVWAQSETNGGLTVTAAAAAGIIVDGREVDGTVEVASRASMAPSSVHFADGRTAFVIDSSVVGKPGETEYALRVWDAERAEHLGFTEIAAFDFDAEWQLTGTYEQVDGGVAFEHGRSQGDRTDSAVTPGVVRFEHEGQQFELLALPDGDTLQIVFADATTGSETYGVGRFLYARPAADGSVELDFNRAVVPPCSFSDQFNCPLPPASNRFPFAVTAGEKKPMFAESASDGA